MKNDVIYNGVQSSSTYPDNWRKGKTWNPAERCRSCIYRSSNPAEYGCDFAHITGRCRSAEVSDPALLNPRKCPLYSAGGRKTKKGLRGNTRTSQIEKETFARLHRQGCTDAEMAEYFGVAKSTVSKYRNSLGLVVNRSAEKQAAAQVDYEKLWSLYRAGYYDKQMAEACGCAISSVRKFRKNNCLPSNEENKNNARFMRYKQLYEMGWTDGEIAAETGVSKTAVLHWRRRLSLPVNKRKDGREDG